MKFFTAFLALVFAAAEAGYAPAAVPVVTSVWPAYGVYGKSAVFAWPYGHDGWNNAGWNTWNNGWNSWNDDGHGSYGYPGYSAGAWSPANYGHKTVVVQQANLGKTAYPYGLPWGTYGAGVQGWTGHHGGYLPAVVPVSKQVAVTPGSVHVAAVPVGGEKVVVGKHW